MFVLVCMYVCRPHSGLPGDFCPTSDTPSVSILIMTSSPNHDYEPQLQLRAPIITISPNYVSLFYKYESQPTQRATKGFSPHF